MQAEQEFSLKSIRCLRAIDASPWIGEGLAFWAEWDHWGETPRSLTSIVQELQNHRWQQLIEPGSTCIDIGAHSGDTSIAMGLFAYDAKHKRKGTVIAVEPNPDLKPVVSTCLALNSHIADFRLETCAITEMDVDEITLSDHGNSNCNGGIIGEVSDQLRQTLERSAKVTYVAQGMSLRSLIEKNVNGGDYSSVRFIKTDCEGYDKQIIRSSRDVIEQIKPIIFAEWFAWFTPEDDDAFFATIDEIDYVPLNPLSLEAVDRTQRTPDVTCVHKARLNDVRSR